MWEVCLYNCKPYELLAVLDFCLYDNLGEKYRKLVAPTHPDACKSHAA